MQKKEQEVKQRLLKETGINVSVRSLWEGGDGLRHRWPSRGPGPACRMDLRSGSRMGGEAD